MRDTAECYPPRIFLLLQQTNKGAAHPDKGIGTRTRINRLQARPGLTELCVEKLANERSRVWSTELSYAFVCSPSNGQGTALERKL